jgi:AAA15 family ATPase/GTPase
VIVEFRVTNFRSIKDEQVLSLVASRDKAHDSNLINQDKLKLLKSAGIFGQNASGKSNLIRALGFMVGFVTYSATRITKGEEVYGISPFLFDSHTRKRPSVFEITSIADGVRYEYGFSVDSERIHEEWITAYPEGRPQRWLERNYDRNKKKTNWTFQDKGQLPGSV